MKRFKKRPSPAMIVAITALFISLVGTAFAGPIAEISNLNKKDKRTVRKISRNISGKVSNRRITKRAPGLSVNTAKTADTVIDGAIITDKLADAAVKTGKIGDDEVTGAKINESTLGEVPSAAKLNGQLPSQFLGSEIVLARKTSNVTTGNRGFANVPCPAGHQVIGGGARFDELDDDNRVVYNGPAFSGQTVTIPGAGSVPTAWQASAFNGSASTDTLYVWAICAKLHSP